VTRYMIASKKICDTSDENVDTDKDTDKDKDKDKDKVHSLIKRNEWNRIKAFIRRLASPTPSGIFFIIYRKPILIDP